MTRAKPAPYHLRKHRHRWQRSSYSALEITYGCRCGEWKTVATTPAQKKEFRREFKLMWKQSGELHKLWHSIVRKYEDPKASVPDRWRISGYALIKEMEKVVKRHPEIHNVRVDDAYHCGSDIYFIPHQRPGEFMGYTALYIPQCTGEQPTTFFLYPRAIKDMIAVLIAMWQNAQKVSGKKRAGAM